MESAELKEFILKTISEYGTKVSDPGGTKTREFPLRVDPHKFYADFAFRISSNKSWLFVEDDEGQSATSNASKYWYWIKTNKIAEAVHLVHIIGPSYGSHKRLAQFVSDEARSQFPNFEYHQIVTESWDDPKWMDLFKQEIRSILM